MIDIENFKNLITIKEVDNYKVSTYTFDYTQEFVENSTSNNKWFAKIDIAPTIHYFSINNKYNFNDYTNNSFEKLIIEKYYELSIKNKNREYYKIVDIDIQTDKIIKYNILDETFYRQILNKITMMSNNLTINSYNSCNRIIMHPKLLNILLSNDKYHNSFEYNIDTRMYKFSMLNIWVSQYILKNTILFMTNFVDMSTTSLILFHKDNYFTLAETEASIVNYISMEVNLKLKYQLRKEKLRNMSIY